MYYDKVIKVNVEIGQSCCIIPEKKIEKKMFRKRSMTETYQQS